jgi:uncharacterized tellurite resistance protein B-like protein
MNYWIGLFIFSKHSKKPLMIDPIKIEHFRNLVSLAAADGKLADLEKIALSKIAYDRGIPLERFNVMLEKASEYVFLIPQNQEEKEKQLEEMINFAMVDGEFAKAEVELITTVAEKLGFKKEEVQQRIKSQSY